MSVASARVEEEPRLEDGSSTRAEEGSVDMRAGRSPETVRDDLGYLLENYGSQLYRLKKRPCGGPELPVIYVYDA